MSDQAPSAYQTVVSDFAMVLSAVGALFPAQSAAIAVAAKIVQGIADAVPSALALINQIKSGTPPTAAQLAAYISDYEAAYETLNADIAEALKTA